MDKITKKLRQLMYLILLIGLVGGLFCLGQAGQVEAEIIFEDDFDSYDDWSSSVIYGQTETAATTKNLIFSGTRAEGAKGWDSYRTAGDAHTFGNPLFQINLTNTRGGSGKSLKVNFESNIAVAGGGVNLWLGGAKGSSRTDQSKTGYDALYVRMALKFDPTWTLDNGALMKLFRLYTNKAPDWGEDLSTEWDYTFTYGNCQFAYPVLAYGNDFKFGWSTAYTDIPNVVGNGCLGAGWPPGVNQGASSNGGPVITSLMSGWIIFQVYEKLNTPGQSDGVLKMWINNNDPNNPTWTKTGLQIRDSIDRNWNALIALDNLQFYTSSPQAEQYLAMDDLVISTEYIDNDYVIGGKSGDVNDDGIVNILDLQACVNVILGTETRPDFIQRAEEVAAPQDECNVLDVQGIVNIILSP